MTQDFRDMLYLLGRAVNNCEFEVGKNINAQKIRELAISQGVYSLVFPELEKICNMSAYTREFLSLVGDGIKRNTFYLKLLSELKQRGKWFCLLKGASISRLYPIPEYRISGDTDILINPDDEAEIKSFLIEKGCEVKKRDKNEHHAEAYHPVGGLMEVHVRLYNVTAEKMLLDGMNLYAGEYSEVEVDGEKIPVLGVNDALMYLTIHYIKHFVGGGGGVRQMLDLLVYMEHHKDEINHTKYFEALKALRYDTLIEAVKTIGAKYWGFDYPIKNEELADRLLTDCEIGGIFGREDDSRKRFKTLYYQRRSKKGTFAHNVFMLANDEHGIINRIFLSQKELVARGYKYAKNKILIPFAWVNWIMDVLIYKIKGSNKNTGIGKDRQERLNLMKDLEMID